MQKDERHCREEMLYGTVTVGERGQIVIPAEARKELDIQPGDKMLILKHPSGKGLMLVGVETMRDFMSRLMETLQEVDSHGAGEDGRP